MPHYFLSEEAAQDLQNIVGKQIDDLEKQIWQKKAIWNDLGNKYLCDKKIETDYQVIEDTDSLPEFKCPEKLKDLGRMKLAAQNAERAAAKVESPALLRNTDIFIPKFEYDPDKEKFFENIFFWELQEGRVVLEYGQAHYYTTKEKIMSLPYPPPVNYYDSKRGWNSTNEQAVKKYRKYLAEQDEKNDPDRAFKPMLSTNTRTDYDGGKIEGPLE